MLFVTGGNGFVLSNLVRYWLESDSSATCIVLDAAPPDNAAERFFRSVHERLVFIQADVLDTATWLSEVVRYDVTHIVHGATITPPPARERAQPSLILETNIMGTVSVLEWARTLPTLERFIYASSGAVYCDIPSHGFTELTLEEAPADPDKLYAISKFASERITRRYGELFDLDVVSVRFSSVFGPMDRETPGRATESIPYLLAHLALAGKPIRVNALEAGGDWIHACDVARALALLLRAQRLQHKVYNVAYGKFVTVEELLVIIKEVIPDLRYDVVTAAEADIIHDPRLRQARWGAYDISRLYQELGWTPRPLREALHSYIAWLEEHE